MSAAQGLQVHFATRLQELSAAAIKGIMLATGMLRGRIH